MTDTEPRTEAGRALLERVHGPHHSFGEWAYEQDRDAILEIERQAAEAEHRRLSRLGAQKTTPEAQAAALRKYNPEIVAAIESLASSGETEPDR